MSDELRATASEPRRLASILDAFSPDTVPSLDDLELAMTRDTECRCLAALNRALARLAVPATVPTESPPADARH